MTFTRQVTIFCDRCGQWDQASMTVATLRRELRQRGWRAIQLCRLDPNADSSRLGDVCPECARAIEKGGG